MPSFDLLGPPGTPLRPPAMRQTTPTRKENVAPMPLPRTAKSSKQSLSRRRARRARCDRELEGTLQRLTAAYESDSDRRSEVRVIHQTAFDLLGSKVSLAERMRQALSDGARMSDPGNLSDVNRVRTRSQLRQLTIPRPIDGMDIVRKRSTWSTLKGNQKLLALFLRCKERHPDQLVSLSEHVIDVDFSGNLDDAFRQIMCLDGAVKSEYSDKGQRQQTARSRLSSLGAVMGEQGLEPPTSIGGAVLCFGKLDPSEKRQILEALVVALEKTLQEKVFEREIQIVFRQLRRVLNSDGGEGFVITAARLLETEVRLYVDNGVCKNTDEFTPAATCVLIQRTNEICQRVPVSSSTVSDMTRTLIDNCGGCIVLEGWNMLLRKMAHSMASLFCLESECEVVGEIRRSSFFA
ncbi:MAG: uncharacterized protein KVP18_001999 [Porospora cf. gigantea A]|uniref:uncharacterized protein n=1 Tax=Porospora cf. gigantea A TaxID=2853593 RepID=UPI003559D354|nr:MAG: hypothetical protein KVP18_001999 [Porospora cf. gigantea A]